jgi:hypothetical protein
MWNPAYSLWENHRGKNRRPLIRVGRLGRKLGKVEGRAGRDQGNSRTRLQSSAAPVFPVAAATVEIVDQIQLSLRD